MPAEISKIKPNLQGYEIPEPKFQYKSLQLEYDSYEQNGFNLPEEWERSDYQQRLLLSKVDITKGKIKVRVKTISRTLAVDAETNKIKQYLTADYEFVALNAWGEVIKCIELSKANIGSKPDMS